MIKVTTNHVEATDSEGNVLFTLCTDDGLACNVEIKNLQALTDDNFEQVTSAVRKGVQMLGMDD
jgi:predicted type IV restriction endonuclease